MFLKLEIIKQQFPIKYASNLLKYLIKIPDLQNQSWKQYQMQ